MNVLQYLAPPTGFGVRKVVGFSAIAIGLPRVISGANFGMVTELAPAVVYGLGFLILGLALLVTSGRWRLRLSGRLAAVVGAGMFATLAADVAHLSLTSLLINLMMAYALIGEAGEVKKWDC